MTSSSLQASSGLSARDFPIRSHDVNSDLGFIEPSAVRHAPAVFATAIVQESVDRSPGTGIETKPAGVVLHTRTADDAVSEAEVAHTRQRLTGLTGIVITDGKKVLVSSVVRVDKYQGIEKLRELSGATTTLFASDDVTDEDAMAVLGPEDVGVKVGPGESRVQ